MSRTESSAVIEFINSVRAQPIDDGSGGSAQRPVRETVMRNRATGHEQVRRAPPLPNRPAQGTPAPVLGTQPPPLPRNARGTVPPQPAAEPYIEPYDDVPDLIDDTSRSERYEADGVDVEVDADEFEETAIAAPAASTLSPESFPPLPQARPSAPPQPSAIPHGLELTRPPGIVADAHVPHRAAPVPTSPLSEAPRSIAPSLEPDPALGIDADLDFSGDPLDEPLEPARASRLPLFIVGGLGLTAAAAVGIWIGLSGPEVGGEGEPAPAPVAATQPVEVPTQQADPVPVARPMDEQPAEAAVPEAAEAADAEAAVAGTPAVDADQALAADDEEAAAAGGEAFARAVFISDPAGATVTLIDNGQPVVLGTSPVVAEIDPARTYQAMFSHATAGTALAPVKVGEDGSAVVNVRLGKDGGAVVAAPAAAEEERAPEKVTRRAAPRKTASKPKRARSKPSRAAAAGGKGTLLIGSKPPCEIYVDGKNTGMKTPQRDLQLSAGKHTITLVNREFNIKHSFRVDIDAGKKTRVIKDMSKRLD